MDAERDGAIPLTELADIARSVQQTVDQIARSLNDRSGKGRPPDFLKKLSALEAVGIEPGSAVLEIEAPHDMEQFSIEFGPADAGVQAVELFVRSIDALDRGNALPAEIGEPAMKSLRSFTGAMKDHRRVSITSEIGGTTTKASFAPHLLIGDALEERSASDRDTSEEFVGMLYAVNLHTRTYRVEDAFSKTRRFKLADALDQTAIVSMLGDTVHVRVVVAEGDSDTPDQLIAVAVDRVEPPKTSDYYTWNLEKALEGKEPLRSIEDLAIPGLDDDEADAFWHAVND